MSAVTLPVNIVIAVSRLIRGFYSVWVKVISLLSPQIDLSYDKISEPAKYLVDQP